tara:strand:+ start:103787 stop:106009 length:2223 start_codon:yes stop_codon:yes gene_type:complete
MKNLKTLIIFLGLFTLIGLNLSNAQDDVLQYAGENGDPLDLYGYKPKPIPINSGVETEEFNFQYNFNDINMSMNLAAAMRAAQTKALNKWLGQQEDVFKDNINNILGSNYSNFKDAQKAFLTKRETELIAGSANYISTSHNNEALRLEEVQTGSTLQLVALDQCIFGDCGELENVMIGNVPIRNISIDFSSGNAQLINSQIDRYERYKSDVINNFGTQEYESASNKHWAKEVYNLQFDTALRDNYVQQQISHYKNRALIDKVTLMAAYLNQYVARGPIIVPNTLQIPVVWSNANLLDIGKSKAASRFTNEELVFKEGYIEERFGYCVSNDINQNYYGLCNSITSELNAIKNRVIAEHKSFLAKYGSILGNRLYGSQWTRRAEYGWLRDINNVIEIQNTLAFLEKNQNSSESINAAKEITKIMHSGSTKEKKFVLAFLTDDFETVFNMLFEGAEYSALYPCPTPPCDELLEPISALTAKIVVDFIDAIPNFLLFISEPHLSDGAKGKLIRALAENINKQIPADVDNKTLGRLFKVRRRGLVYELDYANDDFRSSLLDVGMTSLDLFALISPGSGSTRYLFIKTGGSITASTLSNYLKLIAVNAKKIDGVINSLTVNARYYLDGTGTFRVVGGHHPLAKIAFESDSFYKFRDAFSVSTSTLEKFGGKGVHNIITGQQNSLYSTFAKTGNRLTIEKMAEIEIQAMVNAGIPRDIAEGWIIKALQDLKTQGVKVITNIPWNGRN